MTHTRWLFLHLALACRDLDGPGTKPDSGSDPSDTTTDTTDTPTDTSTDTTTDTTAPGVTFRVLATGLTNPFEIVVGPEPDTLWVTERTIGNITQVSTVGGSKTTLLTIEDVQATANTQEGLLGMAIRAADGVTDVYVAYTYAGAGEVTQAKIVRYRYDGPSVGLVDPVTVIEGLPGSTDHNSGRLRVGPDDLLYYTIGDQGHNQLSLFCQPNHAQDVPTAEQVAAEDWSLYQGKILRIGLDGGIPADNPLFDGVRSHIYTVGHRNAQGLAFAADGTLWSAEQGPKSDDEVNAIVAGGNYGWPYVAGYQDDQAYAYANWSASAAPPCGALSYDDYTVPPSVPVQEESAWTAPSSFVEPVATLFTVPDDHDFQDPLCASGGLYFICWPTIAASSLEVYEGGPLAEPSVLVTGLKSGTVHALPLAGGDLVDVHHTTDRYRDTAVSADGARIWIATDNQGLTRDVDGSPTSTLAHPGAILELRWQ